MAVLAKDHRFWFWFDNMELPGCPITDFGALKGAIGAYLWDSASPMLSLFIDDINVATDIIAAIEPDVPLPAMPVLHQNYPQPVRYGTNIEYDLPSRMQARLEVYTLHGQRIATLVDGLQDAGRHTAAWSAAGHPAGMYLLRLSSQNGVQEKRLVVMR
jgi:hypothetical protein